MAKKVFHIFTTVLLIVLVLIVIIVFICRVRGESPSILGYHIFRVSSDSMEPTLQVGEIILVKKTSSDQIHKNDIITFKGTQGELAGKMITHRVIEEPRIVDGKYYFKTMGDKAGAKHDPEIDESQIEGKYIRSIAFIDKLYTFFLSPVGLISFIALILILFGYEMISLVISYKSLDEKDEDYYAPKNKKPKKKRK
ncbi:signal peptidase I [Ruminococcus sp.]|uniref:signal peptidase I n=1 Tax=Ruminococcus sp. TaxID=41978 RepID=UPI0038671DB4